MTRQPNYRARYETFVQKFRDAGLLVIENHSRVGGIYNNAKRSEASINGYYLAGVTEGWSFISNPKMLGRLRRGELK